MYCLSSAHAVGDCNAMSGDDGGGWSVMAQWRAARRPSQSWGTFARVHQRAEARSRSARAVSAWPQIMYFPEEPGCFSEDAGVEAGAVTFDLKEGGHQRAEEEAHLK